MFIHRSDYNLQHGYITHAGNMICCLWLLYVLCYHLKKILPRFSFLKTFDNPRLFCLVCCLVHIILAHAVTCTSRFGNVNTSLSFGCSYVMDPLPLSQFSTMSIAIMDLYT